MIGSGIRGTANRGKAAEAVKCGACGKFHPRGFTGNCDDPENRLRHAVYCSCCKAPWRPGAHDKCLVCKAAPDLLSAAEDVLAHIRLLAIRHGGKHHDLHIEALERAVAKAKGRG